MSFKKLNNNTIDDRLLSRKIKRIGNYINIHTQIEFKCLICDYTWITAPHGIINHNTGCPNCASRPKLSIKLINERCNIKNIKRISNVFIVNNRKKITVQCLNNECYYVWDIFASGLTNKSGCAKCARNAKLSLEQVNENIKDRNILLISEYKNISLKGKFRCIICNCEWFTKINSVVNAKTGCPQCSDRRLNNKIIDDRLSERKIIRLNNYINAFAKIKFKCLNIGCGNIWEAATHEVIDKKQGCPACCPGKKNEKIVRSFLIQKNVEFIYQCRLKNIDNNYPNLIVDFYLPNHKMIIEYNGTQHYNPVCFNGISKEKANLNFEKQIKRDNKLTEFCSNNLINLIYIDGRIYNGDKLNPYLKDLRYLYE